MLNCVGHLECIITLQLGKTQPGFCLKDRRRAYGRFSSAEITDAKSCFEHIHSHSATVSISDQRAGLDLLQVKEAMQALGGEIRWSPGSRGAPAT